MLDDATRAQLTAIAVRNMLVDRLTARVHERLSEAGVDAMLVKGPVVADALYAETVRSYADCDLLVRLDDWGRAVEVLTAAGFSDQLGPLAHPRLESIAGTPFARDGESVDLHATIPGLEGPPEEVWRALRATAASMLIGGRPIPVAGRSAMIMHIALHASHHRGSEKPAEDLRRAIERCGVAEWRAAAELAAQLGGLASFTAGLRSIDAGETLAATLGVAHHTSMRVELQHCDEPLARGLHQLLSSDMPWPRKVAFVRSELFPNPKFMRWRSEAARSGAAGLVASYPRRWLWLARNLPGGCAELVRAWRRHHG